MLYLASTSPRRRYLLTQAGLDYRLIAPGEEIEGVGDPRTRAAQRAASKARGADGVADDGWVLGVDTVVEYDGEELGLGRDRVDVLFERRRRGSVVE